MCMSFMTQLIHFKWGVILFLGTTCFCDAGDITGHVTRRGQRAAQGVVCLNQFSTMKDPCYFAAKDDPCSRFTLWCSSASSVELILCPLQFPSVGVKAGCRLRWAPVTMHPMPVCSVSGGDIFDCIQRGNVEQCIQFLQTDRSVLKQKGELEWDVMKSRRCSFHCSVFVQPRATASCVFLSVQPVTVTDGISSFAHKNLENCWWTSSRGSTCYTRVISQ